ncbi:MAG: HAMP domain-containing sensor histidine kinase [Eubacteriales bacterium]|nr:HAMP domain-containing sensor histidine kinase [Eubacteriales bacterium]
MKSNPTTEQMKNEFRFTLSKLSHEIRNPIALISSEFQMLSSTHPELSSYEGWENIMDNLEYVTALLNELSSFNNAQRVTLQSTSLEDFLRSILPSVKATLDYLGITLRIQVSPGLPSLPIDRIKLRQALLNLLRNAQEAVPCPGGVILVRAFPTELGACICIEDNGCGISPEHLKDIFSPFVTFKPSGSGLGLAVARQIAEAHGGSVMVKSKPGKGSSFQLSLGFAQKAG